MQIYFFLGGVFCVRALPDNFRISAFESDPGSFNPLEAILAIALLVDSFRVFFAITSPCKSATLARASPYVKTQRSASLVGKLLDGFCER